MFSSLSCVGLKAVKRGKQKWKKLLSGDWCLMTENGQTPLLAPPKMPLTTLQRRWLKALLDTCIGLFDPDPTGLEEVEPLFTPEELVYYDRSVPGDPYTDPGYRERFRLLLAALEQGQWVEMIYRSAAGREFVLTSTPKNMEYSPKDDRFRLLLDELVLHEAERFTTIHNYIDVERRILRKGAVSAQKGEILLIPINMRDGALLCRGKGNPEWNYSAPHGAGRLLSRSAARESLSVEEFCARMEGVYTTCVGRSTLDESPMAYKGIGDILDNIAPTAEVLEHLTPVFNFKSGN